MLNLLVVEDDIEQTKQIVNFICQNNNYIKLYGITSSGNEALEVIKNEKVDIIILDLKLEDSSGVEIIKELEKEKSEKYKQSIIITSGENTLVKEICHSSYVFNYFMKPLNFSKVLESLNIIIDESKYKEEIRNVIEKELRRLNFNFTHDGTQYLVDCIYRIYLLEKSNKEVATNHIYQIIANRYNKTANTIYGDIKQAINAMYYDCEEKILKEYFRYNFIMKPKPQEVIYTIAGKIKV